jgi:hypothetical protein
VTLFRDKERVVVVAPEPATRAAVRALAEAHPEDLIVVVVPVLVGRLQFWTGDDRDAWQLATHRLAAWLDLLEHEDVEAEGQVGFAEPVQVVEDLLACFGGQEVVLIAGANDHWQLRGLTERARRRLPIPVAELLLSPARDGLARAA